jgi:AraC family transcriptional regulator of arabinose operon
MLADPVKVGVNEPPARQPKMRTRADPALAARRKTDAVRTLILPPADRAYWQPEPSDPRPLLFLAWGERQFGATPIAPHRRHGWVYLLVESGNPTLIHDGRSDRLSAGTLAVLGPDCAFGWEDEGARRCKLQVWMWRRPLQSPLNALPAHACEHYTMSDDARAELRRWHALTREEILRDDPQSAAALTGLQMLLEATIVRSGSHAAQDDTVARALRWIEMHLATRQPLARLSDFLGVSTATVHRLFRERLGVTVRQKIAEIRHEAAMRMIASGRMTIKEIAYQLGYRHAHDFSRAFRNQTGTLPRRRVAQRR